MTYNLKFLTTGSDISLGQLRRSNFCSPVSLPIHLGSTVSPEKVGEGAMCLCVCVCMCVCACVFAFACVRECPCVRALWGGAGYVV
jgi:hypothetical protein